MQDLFDSFTHYQDRDLEADKIIIIDETGLPSPSLPGINEKYGVSSESPFWGGEQSIEIAKRWFKEEFGVTFIEEIKPMTVYVVQSKKITP